MATPEEIKLFEKEGSDIITKGKPWFEKIRASLEKQYPSDYVTVIDGDTGEYVVAKTVFDAIQLAKKQLPLKPSYFISRVDAKPLVEFGGCPR